MSAVPVWIDTDTGVDDAVALITAVFLEREGVLDIRGVSSVCGNVEEERTFENTRNVLHLCGRDDIPVYPGAKSPLMVPLETAKYVHGTNGLGGAEIEESPAKRETLPACDAIYRAASEAPGELELILLGPETNAATALRKYPDLPDLLKRIVIMGGADVGGNKTPAAEFNIYVDPHAAQTVFKSGVPVIMCGLDVTMKAHLTSEEIKELEASDSKACRLFAESTGPVREFTRKYCEADFFLHDACPVLYAAYPHLFTGQEAGVFVETRGTITRGKTVSDRDTDIKFGIKNTFVVLDLDRAAFAKIVMSALLTT